MRPRGRTTTVFVRSLKEEAMLSTTITDPALPRTTRHEPPLRRLEDRQYVAMEIAFARHGGLSEGDEMARRLRRRSSQPVSLLARWIVERTIVSFDWRGRVLVPNFQLDVQDLMPRQVVLNVASELTPFLDDWNVALWFAEPNAWIEHRLPIDLMASDPNGVLQAARGDRHLARW
jgi:hypothetical protein